MAISFIPNQPILFEAPLFAGQSCLNKDDREYAQLIQADDTMCIQAINNPVQTLYSCDLTVFPNDIVNGDFASDLSSFDEYDFNSGTNLGTPTIWQWSPSGAISDPTATEIGLIQTIPGHISDMFMISFDFSYNAGGSFKIGFGSASLNSWNFFDLLSNYEKNIDGRRCLIVSSYIDLDFAFYCDTSSVTINNIIVRNITSGQCIVPNNNYNAHWSYVESVNGWQKIDGTAATAYPLTLFTQMFNGDKLKLSYKVMNMIEDGAANMALLSYDNNIMAQTYSNGEFAEYFTYSDTTGQPYITGSATAQNGVIYDIKWEEMCYTHLVSLVYPTGDCASVTYDNSSSIPIRFHKDRLIWCFKISLLDSCDIIGGNITSGCYNIALRDCDGTNYQSWTTINYTTDTHPCSVMTVGDCDGYGFNFFFGDSTTGSLFTLRQRLRLLQFNPTYTVKSQEYLYSNGLYARTHAESTKKRLAWFDYVDEATHDTIRTQLLCDTYSIDNAEFVFISEDYEPEWSENGKYNLAQSKVELIASNEVAIFNKKCI